MIAGVFEGIAGLVGLFTNEFCVEARGYLFWALTLVALDVVILCSLAAHGRDVSL